MRTNYLPMHSLDHADSEYVSYVEVYGREPSLPLRNTQTQLFSTDELLTRVAENK